MKEYYQAIFISDIHLGTKSTQANQLCNFLKYNDCDQLYRLETSLMSGN